MIHADPGIPCSVGSRVTVGHRVILHGCTIEDDCLIGMGAILLNGVRVGRGSIVGAGALCSKGWRSLRARWSSACRRRSSARWTSDRERAWSTAGGITSSRPVVIAMGRSRSGRRAGCTAMTESPPSRRR